MGVTLLCKYIDKSCMWALNCNYLNMIRSGIFVLLAISSLQGVSLSHDSQDDISEQPHLELMKLRPRASHETRFPIYYSKETTTPKMKQHEIDNNNDSNNSTIVNDNKINVKEFMHKSGEVESEHEIREGTEVKQNIGNEHSSLISKSSTKIEQNYENIPSNQSTSFAPQSAYIADSEEQFSNLGTNTDSNSYLAREQDSAESGQISYISKDQHPNQYRLPYTITPTKDHDTKQQYRTYHPGNSDESSFNSEQNRLLDPRSRYLELHASLYNESPFNNISLAEGSEYKYSSGYKDSKNRNYVSGQLPENELPFESRDFIYPSQYNHKTKGRRAPNLSKNIKREEFVKENKPPPVPYDSHRLSERDYMEAIENEARKSDLLRESMDLIREDKWMKSKSRQETQRSKNEDIESYENSKVSNKNVIPIQQENLNDVKNKKSHDESDQQKYYEEESNNVPSRVLLNPNSQDDKVDKYVELYIPVRAQSFKINDKHNDKMETLLNESEDFKATRKFKNNPNLEYPHEPQSEEDYESERFPPSKSELARFDELRDFDESNGKPYLRVQKSSPKYNFPFTHFSSEDCLKTKDCRFPPKYQKNSYKQSSSYGNSTKRRVSDPYDPHFIRDPEISQEDYSEAPSHKYPKYEKKFHLLDSEYYEPFNPRFYSGSSSKQSGKEDSKLYKHGRPYREQYGSFDSKFAKSYLPPKDFVNLGKLEDSDDYDLFESKYPKSSNPHSKYSPEDISKLYRDSMESKYYHETFHKHLGRSPKIVHKEISKLNYQKQPRMRKYHESFKNPFHESYYNNDDHSSGIVKEVFKDHIHKFPGYDSSLESYESKPYNPFHQFPNHEIENFHKELINVHKHKFPDYGKGINYPEKKLRALYPRYAKTDLKNFHKDVAKAHRKNVYDPSDQLLELKYNFPKYGYDIDQYFENIPSFGFMRNKRQIENKKLKK